MTEELVFSGYPLSIEFKKNIKEKFDQKVTFKALNEVKDLGIAKLFSEIRSIHRKRLFIALEEESSNSIRSTFQFLFSLSRARELYFIDPQLKTIRFYRRQSFAILLSFLWGNIKARAIKLIIKLDLYKLSVLPRKKVTYKTVKKLTYIKSNLWFGVKAGGSVGHIAGVINGFINQGISVCFAGIERPVMTDARLDFRSISAPKVLAYPHELNNFTYHTNIVSDLSSSDSPLHSTQAIYQRLSINNYSGVKLSRRFKIPFILEYNGSEVWVANNWGKPLRYKSQSEKCELICLKHAHLIVTVSDVLRDELIERGIEPNRIVTYPNCVSPETFDPSQFADSEKLGVRTSHGLSKEDLVFTFVGTFGKWHGVDVLAKTIVELSKTQKKLIEDKRIKFLLVGDGHLMQDVRDILADCEVKDLVTCTGLIPQAMAPSYLAASDVLLSPHKTNEDGSRFFGSPTKLFEYMAMEKPIIASRLEQLEGVLCRSLSLKGVSNPEEPVEDELAILISPNSEQELAQTILEVARNYKRLSILGKNARKEVLEKYTWEKHVQSIQDTYQRLSSIAELQKTYLPSYKVFERILQRLTQTSFSRKTIERLCRFLAWYYRGSEVSFTANNLQFKLEFPDDVGWELLLASRTYEKGTTDVILNRLSRGDFAIDVGANIGWYSLNMGKAVGEEGKIFAFEPFGPTLQKLDHHVRVNNLGNTVHTYSYGLSDREESTKLYRYSLLPHGLTSAEPIYERSTTSKMVEDVQCISLDRFWKTRGSPKVKLIKVDVEGYELKVLKGAEELLRIEKPDIFVEINYETSKAFGWDVKNLLSFLKQYPYKFHIISRAWGKIKELRSDQEIQNGDILVASLDEIKKIQR